MNRLEILAQEQPYGWMQRKITNFMLSFSYNNQGMILDRNILLTVLIKKHTRNSNHRTMHIRLLHVCITEAKLEAHNKRGAG